MAKENADLEKFLKEMDKKFGERAIVEFDDSVAHIEALPTGIPSLDYILGIGGLPRGRVIEVYGPEGAGKTTIAIRAMAECQKRAGMMPINTYEDPDNTIIKPLTGRVGMIDVEHAFSPEVAKNLGLNVGKGSGFFFSQPTGGDEAMQILEYMVNSGLFDMITVDSVAGLTSLDEQNADIGSKVIAGTASLMSSSLKKLVPLIDKAGCTVIFINQIREKPAVMFGSPETTPGGRALKFYSSIRLRVAKQSSIMENSTTQCGHTVGISVKKNKVAPPFKSTAVDLYYYDNPKGNAGFAEEADLMETAKLAGVIQLSGSQYQFVNMETGEVVKANGKVKFFELLDSRPDIKEAIKSQMLNGVSYGEVEDGDTSTDQQ